MPHDLKPKPGDTVLLIEVPPGLQDDLPPDDLEAISEVIGKPIRLKQYDDVGRAGLEFKDRNGELHCIYVSPNFISPMKATRIQRELLRPLW